MSVQAVHEYGPYTLYDLDALPEDGKRYELADGWLTELSPSPWHDHAADRLKDILKNAARLAGAEVYVAGGPNDIATPAGVRKPSHLSRVRGETSSCNWRSWPRGSSRASAARTARSAQDSLGVFTWRRSTAT